ncbi:hypothetical protein MKLM6_2564 [Methylomonas koyamae]|nr:hypothetical protein AYM39_12425 [Methylomonas sp. DH-1]ATG90783.1 hypothetical protein MKLM6_2564 [Methylomonas koyamae]
MTVSKSIPTELLDSLLSSYQKPEDLIGENGLLKQLTKALVERALEPEMTEHLSHAKHEAVTNPSGNARNGKSRKTLKGDFGELPIEILGTAMAASSRKSSLNITCALWVNALDRF